MRRGRSRRRKPRRAPKASILSFTTAIAPDARSPRFVDWSKNDDEKTKPAYYPNVAKRELFAQGYIAEKSGHSTGLAVDLGVKGWDFGTPFDFFDRRSWTGALKRGVARLNRARLVALMRRHGFDNYPREWWHFTLRGAKNVESRDVEIE